MAIGGSITDITQAKVLYTPSINIPWSQLGGFKDRKTWLNFGSSQRAQKANLMGN